MLNKLFCRGVFCELNFDGHEHIDKNIDMHDDAKTTTKLSNKPIPKRKCGLWCAFELYEHNDHVLERKNFDNTSNERYAVL